MNTFLRSAMAVALLSTTSVIAAPADQPGHESPAPGSKSNAMSAVEDTTAGAVGTVSADMTHTTKGFATAAAISDMYEVTAGKIALQRSNNADVKAFAQQMVDAHTKTTEKLKGLLPPDITPPAHVDDRRQGMLDNLRGVAASGFDDRYITQQVAAHKEANILMRGYAKTGDNKAIKAFASETDQAVKMHLSMAERLAKKFK